MPRSDGLRSIQSGFSVRQQVEQQPPEARVVLGQVVEERLGQLERRAADDVAAVDVDRAARHEREPDQREVAVERRNAGDPQRVEREVAGPVGDDLEVRRPVGLDLPGHGRGLDPDDPRPALDRDPRRLRREAECVRGVRRVRRRGRRHGTDEEDAQDPVVRRRRPRRGRSPFRSGRARAGRRAAARHRASQATRSISTIGHRRHAPRTNTSTRRSPVTPAE